MTRVISQRKVSGVKLMHLNLMKIDTQRKEVTRPSSTVIKDTKIAFASSHPM